MSSALLMAGYRRQNADHTERSAKSNGSPLAEELTYRIWRRIRGNVVILGTTTQQCVSYTTTSKIGNKPRVAELLDDSQPFASIRTVKIFLQCSFDNGSPGMDMNQMSLRTPLGLHRLPDSVLDCLATSCMLKAVA